MALVRKKLRDFIDKNIPQLRPRISKVLLATTELVTNIVKHANHGTVVFYTEQVNGRPALILTTEDKGPGIKDLVQVREKGFSTAGTLGLGFTVIANNSDLLEIRNTGHGLFVKIGWFLTKDSALGLPTVEYHYVIRAMPGQVQCGDYVFAKRLPEKVLFLANIDILGHGVQAYRSVSKLKDAFIRIPPRVSSWEPERFMAFMDGILKQGGLRGGVAAAGLFLPAKGLLKLAMLGNITVALNIDDKFILPASRGGVIGEGIRGLKSYEFTVSNSLLWGMASDGLDSGWVNLFKKDRVWTPKQIVNEAINRNKKNHDDISMVVARWKLS